MLFDLIVGSVLTHSHSYSLVLLSAGVLHPIAFLLILLMIPKIAPVAVLPRRMDNASVCNGPGGGFRCITDQRVGLRTSFCTRQFSNSATYNSFSDGHAIS
jgi:hypothetical protein